MKTEATEHGLAMIQLDSSDLRRLAEGRTIAGGNAVISLAPGTTLFLPPSMRAEMILAPAEG
jgi:hypothetical protein